MTHDRTYRPFRCVSAPRLQGADGSMRQAPRRSAGYAATHPVQPLKGLPGTRATDISYRALAPGGAGFCYQICTGTSESRPTAHYSLLTAHSTYTFSAKERDSETGLSYFGSRYYSSDLSIWLSVDPMSDKYASLSPYTYCADNPVKLVDPDGEEIYVGDNYYYQNGSLYYKGTTDVYVPTKGSFEEKALIALNTLRGTKQGWELMSPFEGETNKTDKKDKDIIIKEASKNPNTPGKVEVNDYNYSSDNDFLAATIYWNPEGVQLFQTLEPNATTDLGHEFSHAYDMATGVKYTIGKHDNCPLNEWQAVYRENMIREELGAPYRRGYKVLLHNKKDGTTTPYLTKMLTSGGMPFLP